MTSALPRPRLVVGGLIAGLSGALTILVPTVALNLAAPGTAPSLPTIFAFNASTLVGKAAATSGDFVALGGLLHVLVALGWAVGYAVLARTQTQLLTRPLISGAGFGLIVYFAMQLVIVAANEYRIPTPAELGLALLAHLVFYGIPVALIVARLGRSE
jgi:uncharacterized membrane protein YagU involved in acid resistance